MLGLVVEFLGGMVRRGHELRNARELAGCRVWRWAPSLMHFAHLVLGAAFFNILKFNADTGSNRHLPNFAALAADGIFDSFLF